MRCSRVGEAKEICGLGGRGATVNVEEGIGIAGENGTAKLE